MKTIKASIATLMMVVAVGCNLPPEPMPNPERVNETGFEYRIQLIDGCEYISWEDVHSAKRMIHKGNCKNHVAAER